MKIYSVSSGARATQWLFLGLLVWMPWFGLWAAPASSVPAAEKNRVSVYDVLGVDVAVPLSPKGVEATHEAGVAQAQKEALPRLFRRMLLAADQEAQKPFLQTLLAQPKRLMERVVVRAEKQHADQLTLSVDLLFSKKEVSAALVGQGLSYNETPYPQVLLLIKEPVPVGGGEPLALGLLQNALVAAAREYGIVLLLPMGDLEDLTHLSWDRAASGEMEVLDWVLARYGATHIWALQVEATVSKGKKGQSGLKSVGKLVVSRSNSAPVTSQIEEEKTGGSVEEVASAVYPSLATKLVQSVMESWIQEHALQPGLRHQVHLRVVHDAQLARLTEFLQKLRKIPGVKEPKMLNSSARETSFEFEYQGSDDVLLELLAKMGVYMDKTKEQFSLWLITAPSIPEPPAPVQVAPAAPAAPAASSAPVAPAGEIPNTPPPKKWM